MKIAVATDDYVSITGHVGKCAGFLIFDVENGQILKEEKRKNDFTNHGNKSTPSHAVTHNHEHGKRGHERLAEGLGDCSHLICHGAGWRLVEDLKVQKIELVLTRETDAKMAAIQLERGNLVVDESLTCHSH